MKLFVDNNMPRRAGEKQFQLDEWIEGSPFETLLGVEILEADSGQAVLQLPYTVKLSNGGGVMHGGAMTTLADTAVAMAIKSLIPEGTPFATIKLSMEFIAPVLEGRVTARARVTGPQDRTFHGECELFGENGKLCARMTSLFKLVRAG
jgi:uncharacterized protein (TIGR00369 family)